MCYLNVNPTDDKTLHWAVTRIGQVILFWGALEVLLKTLDVLTNSDLLLMLQLSLAPDLGFLGSPWVALLLVALGFTIIWRNHRPRKARKSVLEQNAEPDTKDYSLIRAAGLTMPLFLALVCGMAFGGFEWSSPTHGQLARGTGPSSPHVLSGAVHRRPPAFARGPGTTLPGPSTDQASSVGTDSLARLAPRLTPEIDEDGEGPSAADTTAVSSLRAQLPADPRAAFRAYAYNGARMIFQSGQVTSVPDTPQRKLFDQIEAAHQSKNWLLLASLSESAIQQTPQWLTPYLFAGEAYANLGKVDRAIRLLEYVKKNGAGNPEYDFAIQQAAQIRESIRQQYGR